MPRVVTQAHAVRARLAQLLLGATGPPVRVGTFTLWPSQARAIENVRAAFAEFGGVLLADPPGTGKTVIALAAAAGFSSVLVAAPAALRGQWLAAAARAGVPITFMSFEALSRGATPRPHALVIADEAHHLRTASARRYGRLAAACVGARVLLLSATPVVNRPADRDSLLALFLGSRAARLDAAALGRCVVRRTGASRALPHVRRIPPLRGDAAVAGVAESLVTLPPPLPAAEGTAATPLVLMSLAMAWHSSLAALDAALRRRVQRGEVFADILRANQWPSHAALRHWVISGPATQLALPGLLGDADRSSDTGTPRASRTATRPGSRREAQRTLAAHLAAVRALRALVRPRVASDTLARAEALRSLAREHPGERIVVFARHADTIRALHAALRSDPGVIAITGSRVHAAAGRWTRDEVLRAIGPRAKPLRADDPLAIRILLATDVVAEGVELQGVSIVVHADLPWTPARVEQRRGRVARLGSTAREITETTFAAPNDARALVRLGARLLRKATARRTAVRDGEAQGRLEALLERWSVRGRASVPDGPCAIASVKSTIRGFIAAVEAGAGVQLLCGYERSGRWRIATTPGRSLRVLARSEGAAVATSENARRMVVRVIRRALARRAARALARGGSDGHGGSGSTSLIARVVARLDIALRRTSVMDRAATAESHRRIILALGDRLEAAREARLRALLARPLADGAFVRALEALLADRPGDARSAAPAGHRLRALLLLMPEDAGPAAARSRAPPSASP